MRVWKLVSNSDVVHEVYCRREHRSQLDHFTDWKSGPHLVRLWGVAMTEERCVSVHCLV